MCEPRPLVWLIRGEVPFLKQQQLSLTRPLKEKKQKQKLCFPSDLFFIISSSRSKVGPQSYLRMRPERCPFLLQSPFCQSDQYVCVRGFRALGRQSSWSSLPQRERRHTKVDQKLFKISPGKATRQQFAFMVCGRTDV